MYPLFWFRFCGERNEMETESMSNVPFSIFMPEIVGIGLCLHGQRVTGMHICFYLMGKIAIALFPPLIRLLSIFNFHYSRIRISHLANNNNLQFARRTKNEI